MEHPNTTSFENDYQQALSSHFLLETSDRNIKGNEIPSNTRLMESYLKITNFKALKIRRYVRSSNSFLSYQEN